MSTMVVGVQLKWISGLKYDIQIRGKHKLMVDAASEVKDGDEAPSPVDLLAAAVGSCLASSFTFCASKVRAELADLTVSVQAEISRVEGYLRVTGLNVTINPQFSEKATEKKQERCIALFRNYCTVTESVTRGIPVNITVKT